MFVYFFKSVYCHPVYLTYIQEHIMQHARLDEWQAGIKTAGRNANNLRHADDTLLMAESKEELKNLLIRLKKSEKVALKLNIQKTKIMTSGPITLWQKEGEKVKAVTGFIFLGSKITAYDDCSHEIKTLGPWKKSHDTFIGRTDAEAEAPIFWPRDGKT